MKTFNRILSMLLVIAMVASIAVMGVVAENQTVPEHPFDSYIQEATGDTIEVMIISGIMYAPL